MIRLFLQNISIPKGIRLSVALLTGVFLTGCYSPYVQLKLETFWGAKSDMTGNRIVFVAATGAYQRPAGISRFPDGGTPRYLQADVSLYLCHTDSLKLQKLVNLTDLQKLIGITETRWKIRLGIADSVIVYRIQPTSSWETYLRESYDREDSLYAKKMRTKYNQTYMVNIKTGRSAAVDSLLGERILAQSPKPKTSLSSLLEQIPLSEWGLVLKAIAPKPAQDYIDETIYLKNESSLTRRAVMEQYFPQLTGSQIRELIAGMDQYKSTLEGYDRSYYERESETIYQKLHELLQKDSRP